jgi:uncharacterized protein (TIGR02594 family)
VEWKLIDTGQSMKKVELSAFDLPQRFVGIKEAPGSASNPHVLAMLRPDEDRPEGDDVPWCSAFPNCVAWLLRLPRSKDLRARSWLLVGRPLAIEEAEAGFDLIVLKSDQGEQPDATVIDAPGHVGLFARLEGENILILGGNQSDAVNVAPFAQARVLGVRRLV